MAVIDAGKKRSRSLCNFLSCFGLTPLPETAKSHKFVPKNKTMPESAVVAAPVAAAGIQPKEKKAKPVNSSFLRWFLKRYDKERKGEEGSRRRRNHYGFRQAPIGSQTKPRVQNSQVHRVASKYKMQAEPTQVYRIRDRTKVGTRVVHPSSLELQASECQEICKGVIKYEHEPLSRLLTIIVMVLTLLLVVSWITVIICLCTWLYLFPRLRATIQKENATGNDKRGNEEIDLNSKEYKKMVVLKGLLERDRARRLSPMKTAGAQ
ncbi:uncharacterized protein LOC121992749 [Zingiber officinale]|uniref:Uncharacterized protein n=1 Tax=Zingiber officinale TaxID=94328 RepID=A0A8J5G0C6_ZINOF|nr:uncharacterized protein LOC121992749 [Zingiber officinale]KAG6496147.1 hypothetical protein ZIOFF_043995 [Zingiber officinale]